MKKLSLIVLMVVVSACMVFANAGTETTAAAADKPVEYKDRVTIANSAIITMLDPAGSSVLVNGYVYRLTHDTLVGVDYETNEIIPMLATSWEISDDGCEYTFHLRNDVKFYDGTPLKANDVKYTYERIRQSSALKSRVSSVKEIVVVDDYTLKIFLNNPDADLLYNLKHPYFGICCEASGAGENDWGYANGSGPYHLTEWLPANYALCTRNDSYWGELPPTKEIMFTQVGEAATRVVSLEAGDVDICLELPGTEATNLEQYNCHVFQLDSIKLIYVAINCGEFNPALQDVRVRQALNYATNKDDAVIIMKEGYGVPNKGILPGSYEWANESEIEGYPYNPEKAKELLAEAGYPDGITIKLWYNGAREVGMFETLQASWAKAGINLELGSDDSAVASAQTKTKQYDLYGSQWTYSSLGAGLTGLFQTGSGSNRSQFSDPWVDEMLIKVQSTQDTAARKVVTNELTDYLLAQAPIVPIYYDITLIGLSNKVEGTIFTAVENNFRNVKVAK